MDNNLKIVGPAMPDMPWEDRPAGAERYPAAIASAAILFAAVFPQPCRLGAFIGQPFWGEPCQ